MTDPHPTPPSGMPHFERPPTQSVPAPPTTPTAPPTSGSPGPRPTTTVRPTPTNPIARRPWVAAAGAAGAVVVAAAAGYGFGRQVEPAATSAPGGTSAVVTTGGDQQPVDPGTGQLPFELPGSGTSSGQSQGPGQGDPSDGFGAQPGTVTPGQAEGGATTRSGGS